MKSFLHLLVFILVMYHSAQLSVASNFESILRDIDSEEENSKIECVNKLVHNLKCGKHITIVVPDANFKDFIKINSSCYSSLVRTYAPIQWYMNTNLYLVYYENITVGPTAWKIRYDRYWNPRAKFILVASQDIESKELKKIFRKLLKYNIFDVTVFTQINNTAATWTYHPLKEGNCASNYDKIEYLGPCTVNTFIPVAKDVSNCTVYVTGSEILNMQLNNIYQQEELIINTTAEAIGVQLHYLYGTHNANDGLLLKNNTSIGMLNLLQKWRTDITFGAFFLSDIAASTYEAFIVQKYSRIRIITPNSRVKRWENIYKPFRIKSWCLILGSFIVMALTTMTIGSYCLNIKNTSTYPLKLLDYYFGHSNENLFQVKKLRILLIFWIFYAFFIASFYNSAIYSLLTNPGYAAQLYDLNELEMKGYKACISDSFRSYLHTVFNVSLPDNEIPECKQTDTVFKAITDHDNYYTIAYHSQIKKFCGDKQKNFDEIDFLNNAIYGLYLNKGFFLSAVFRKTIRTIIESGLLNNFLSTYLAQKKCQLKHPSKEIYNVLTLGDLELIFYVLFSGYLISLIVFIIEIIWYRLTK